MSLFSLFAIKYKDLCAYLVLTTNIYYLKILANKQMFIYSSHHSDIKNEIEVSNHLITQSRSALVSLDDGSLFLDC